MFDSEYFRAWEEFEQLSNLPELTDLVFMGNPLEEELTEMEEYNNKVVKSLLELKKLDGYPVIRGSQEEEEEDNEDSDEVSDLDEELYNDPTTQEIIRTLVL